MRNPIHVLKSLEEKASVSNNKYERLYRNLYNPEFYLLAYANIAKSQGSMTQGVDGQTLDNMSLPRINRIIESIRNRTYQPKPAKRKYIPKKNGKLRPLGITSTDDKLVQEVVRMILEAIYEPTFSNNSHGFRPKRSCHTALTQVKKNFTGVTWIVEGDIKACFDNFDHHVLVELLRKRISDEAFIGLIWKFLKAGYMEQWQYNCTYSGVPQGSGISPICANIYLSELDNYMQEYKEKYDCEPERRRTTREYERASRRYRKARKALMGAEKSTPELVKEFKDSRRKKMDQHYYNPFEEGFKKIQYNRYADDFVIGVIGSKKDAEKIKEDVKIFLQEKLHLEMSEEKTKVTHSSKPVRYLGYDFKVIHSKNMKRCKNGDMKRVWYGNDLNTALYEKMAAEQDKFRDWLKSQPPEEVLNHAYEYTIREDIVMAMEELELTDTQAQALLESPSPLADVYRYFEKLETGYMDVIRDSIESRADDVCRAKEELRTTPVYPHSAAYASEHGEMAQYNLSYQANSACKEAIEQTISAHYAENRLDTEAAVKDVLEKFGTERVQFILANTIQHKNHDGRISQDNKAWAKTIPMLEDSGASRHSAYLVVDQVNPGLTDLFTRQFRKVAQEQQKSSVLQKLKQESPAHKPAAPKKREPER